MKPPVKWKMAILVWIAIYPLITSIIYFLGPYLMQLPVLLRTFAMTLIMVPLMVFVIMPFLQNKFYNWLVK